jgi:transposase-like protein
MTLTLLVTGSLSLYLILQAAVDLYRHGLPRRDR